MNLQATIRHYDGASWSVAYTGQAGFITSIYAATPDDAWAVGIEGGALHWNGKAWSKPAKKLPRDIGYLWGSSGSDIWGGGLFGAVLHYDGATWSPLQVTSASVVGVTGTAPNNVLAAHEDRGDSPSSVSVPAAGAIPHPLFALWPWRPPLGARQALAVRARPVGSARRRGRRCDSFRLPSPRTGPRPPP